MAQADFYKILGVPRNASLAELKSAYRRLAITWHPDRNPGSHIAEERFKAIAEAYAVLSSLEKRRQYDMMGHDEFRHEFSRENIFRGFEPGDLFSFFGLENAKECLERLFNPEAEEKSRTLQQDPGKMEDFFAGFGQKNLGASGRKRSPDIIVPLFISLAEAVFGATKTVAYNTPRGAKKLAVTIPQGALSGQKIILKNQGPAQPGASAGDVVVTLTINQDPNFSQKGDDLISSVKTTPAELKTGTKLEVSTLDGRKLRLSVPPGAQYGLKLKVPGHGAFKKDGSRGDLLVIIK